MKVPEGLASLASDLRALGYDAEDVAGSVSVRLPLWCSVSFECGPDRVRFVPRFGYSSREGATWVNLVMFTLLVGSSAFVPMLTPLAASYLVVLLGDVTRYVLTESAMSAVRALILTRVSRLTCRCSCRGRRMASRVELTGWTVGVPAAERPCVRLHGAPGRDGTF